MISSFAYYISLLRKDFTEFCDTQLKELGLSKGLLFFILYIGKNPRCSHKALAEALHMDTGHVTRSLAKLEAAGFLRQETNPEDRRGRFLVLEKKGEEAFHFSYQLFKDWDNQTLEHVPEKDRAYLLTFLKKLTQEKEEHRHV